MKIKFGIEIGITDVHGKRREIIVDAEAMDDYGCKE